MRKVEIDKRIIKKASNKTRRNIKTKRSFAEVIIRFIKTLDYDKSGQRFIKWACPINN